MKNILIKIFGKRYLFNVLFSDKEQTAIINSLYKRLEDNIDKEMKYRCETIAKQLMEL